MNQWVYNRNTDLSVFGISLLFAILLSIIFPHQDFHMSMFVYVFIDISHSFTTYFYTLTSDRINNGHHKYFFWGILLLVFALSCSLKFIGMGSYLLKIYTIASLYHFMKQSQAWIFIVSKKTKPISKTENYINSLACYCAIWCPQIISMTKDEPTPWFIPGDIPRLPLIFKDISIIIGLIVLLFYVFFEIKRWLDTRTVYWGKHLHLLYGFSVWSIARLGILNALSPMSGPLVMMACHSFPYFFLGHKYILDRTNKNEKFWPYINNHYLFLLFIWTTCVILTSAQYITVFHVFEKNPFVSAGMITIAVTHYIYDSYLWKKETHPEGVNVFKSS